MALYSALYCALYSALYSALDTALGPHTPPSCVWSAWPPCDPSGPFSRPPSGPFEGRFRLRARFCFGATSAGGAGMGDDAGLFGAGTGLTFFFFLHERGFGAFVLFLLFFAPTYDGLLGSLRL